jgi:hypothetical protein
LKGRVGADETRSVRAVFSLTVLSELDGSAEKTQNLTVICQNLSEICRNHNEIYRNISGILSFFRTIDGIMVRRQ